jgi:hypothetical protein
MKKTLLLILTSVLIFSCTDFIDRKPLDKISEQDVYKSEKLCQAVLYDIYNKQTHNFSYIEYPENATDNGSSKSGWVLTNKVAIAGTFGAANGDNPYGAWKYGAVRKANEFIEKLEVSTIDDEVKQQFIAEARWLRAKFYFQMVKRYGRIPLIKHAQKIDEDLFIKQTSIDSIYDFIETEINDLVANLPNYAEAQTGRASKEAAWALGSRTMLYAKRWQKCIDYSNKIVESAKRGDLNLSPDYQKLFLSEGGDKEVIFEIVFNGIDGKGHDMDWYNIPYSYRVKYGSQTNPTQELVNAYYMKNGLDINDPASGFDPNNPYDNRDPRLDGTILRNGSMFKGRLLDSSFPNGPDRPLQKGRTISGYYLRKHLSEDLPMGALVGYSKTSWKEFRLAEIYLNLAEAENELNGPTELIYKSIEPIRTRLGMPNFESIADKDSMRKKIHRERRIELAYEDHRWWDLIRWRRSVDVLNGKTFTGVKVTKHVDDQGAVTFSYEYPVIKKRKEQVFKEHHYLQPIPHSEREKNPNLDQNIGY